jgi:hypothetical protein
VQLHTLILVGVLLLALILRVGWPGITEFKFDEAGIVRQSLGLIHGGVWPTGVRADINLPHPPLITYLLVVPLANPRNPALSLVLILALCALVVNHKPWL